MSLRAAWAVIYVRLLTKKRAISQASSPNRSRIPSELKFCARVYSGLK